MAKVDTDLQDGGFGFSERVGVAAFAEPLPIPGRPAFHVMVAVLKIVLPIAAILAFLSVLFWPQFQSDLGEFKVQISERALRQAQNMTMIDAEFEGVDDKGQPYVVTAKEVTKTGGDDDVVHLNLPKGDISLNSGAWLALDAREGRYDQISRILDLFGNVTLVHDRGLEIKTEKARLDLAAGTAQGSSDIRGQGPEGWLEAQGFQVLEEGDRIIFTGRSRMVIYQQAQGGGS